MANFADTTVTIYFDAGGDDVSDDVRAVDIRRGRSRALDEFDAGVATIVLDNWDRTYDSANTSSAYYPNITPGKRVTIETDTVVIFDGYIEDWDFDFDIGPEGGAATATVTVVDALASLAAMEFDEWTTTAGQTAGERLTDVLARPEVDWSATTDIDDGASVLQGDLVTWGSNVLSYMQLVARSDMGRLFAARTGEVTFRDRHSTLNVDPTAILFSDEPNYLTDENGLPILTEGGDFIYVEDAVVSADSDDYGIEPESVTVDYGTEQLYNRVSVDREGGIAQTVNDTASQAAPPAGVGVRTLSLSGLLLDSDLQSRDLALFLLDLYSDPTERIDSVVVDVHNTRDDFKDELLELDIAGLVEVHWSPHGTDPQYNRFGIVEGISHQIRFASHLVTFSLSDVAQTVEGTTGSFFTLNHATYGLLDSGNVLAF